MLPATKQKLDALYAGGAHRGTDGRLHDIDERTRVSFEQGELIAKLHDELRPRLSVEIGMAYGFSTLFILDAMARGVYGQHIAIDPFQKTLWHGVGLAAVDDAGLGSRWRPRRFRWAEARSSLALSRMHAGKRRAQFVYIDGSHLFEDTLMDFSLSDKILDIEGLIILDDMWMPAVRRVVDFVTKNFEGYYERVDVRHGNVSCFRKRALDERPWDHFADF